MIFSVLPCMSSQQFAATKLLRHNYTLQCGMMRNLLGGKLLFMTGEEPSLQWCLSFHLLSVDFVKWNTCVLVQHTSAAVMSCCMTDLQVWMMKLGHCSLLNSNKTTHSTRLVWANYVEHESLYVGRKLFSVVVLLFADLLVVCQNYAMLDPEKKNIFGCWKSHTVVTDAIAGREGGEAEAVNGQRLCSHLCTSHLHLG